jgi:16S rRNA (uracil1498-N3)-methyltransferase
MQLPLFFYDGSLDLSEEIRLDEATAKHIFQVLRMKAGEQLMLTDGKGRSALLSILKAEKKDGVFRTLNVESHATRTAKLHLAVAFTKNASRNEWLLEKAVELGVTSILPLSSDRSERQHFRYDRWRNILTSALIQSRQYHLPELDEVKPLEAIIGKHNEVTQKFICHCIGAFSKSPLAASLKPGADSIILIGPEGDFTQAEVEHVTAAGYHGIDLGSQRLRTETAAMSVCAYFNLINYEA